MVAFRKFDPCAIPEATATDDDRELHRLYFESSLHSAGIGRTLLEASLAHPELAAAERVFLSVWEGNERARRLYQSLGFSDVGSSKYSVGAAELEDMVMMRIQACTEAPTAHKQQARGVVPTNGKTGDVSRAGSTLTA